MTAMFNNPIAYLIGAAVFASIVVWGIRSGRAYGAGFCVDRKEEPGVFWLTLIVQTGIATALILAAFGYW